MQQIKEKQENTIRLRLPKRESLSRIGPGTYEVKQPQKVPNMSEIVFKSKIAKIVTKVEDKHTIKPPVGTYNLDRRILRPKPYLQVGPSRVFCETVVKDNIKAHDYERIKKHIIHGIEDQAKITIMGEAKDNNPGPLDYDALDSFMLASKSRSKNVKQNLYGEGDPKYVMKDSRTNYPGPGKYKFRSQFESDKYKVYNAVFISESNRPALVHPNAGDLSAPYSPELAPSKEDFHINEKNIWV